MKKLSALLSSIFFIGFMAAGNVSAAPPADPCSCGYSWELGPGSAIQVMDFSGFPAIIPLSVEYRSNCILPTGARNYSFSADVSNTCNDSTAGWPYYVYPGGDDTYGTTDDYAIQVQSLYTKPWGTGYTVDFRDAYLGTFYTCDMVVTEGKIEVRSVYPYGTYTSTQNIPCVPDQVHTDTPNPALAQVSYQLHKMTGHQAGNERNGMEVWLDMVSNSQDFSQFPIVTIYNDITQSRVEYFDNLRGDLDLSGTVDIADFTILKGNFFKSLYCSCGNYFLN
jgi:hypothetical protein